MYKPFENVDDAVTSLGTDTKCIHRLNTDYVLDLLLDTVGLGRRQIDLVQHGDHLESQLHRRVTIGDALGFDSLRCIHNQQGPLAGRQRARNLVGKIDMTRCVNEIELVCLAITRRIIKPDTLRLYGDAAFALEFHGIEDLVFHFTLTQSTADLNKTISQGRLAVIHVRNN